MSLSIGENSVVGRFQKEIVDTFDRNESKLNYKERRLLELVNQVLNKSSNIYQEQLNILDLFKYYIKSLRNRETTGFIGSLENSRKCMENSLVIDNCLDFMQKNKPDSFLIVPVMSNNHVFAAVVRKIDSGFNVTLVNKGDRSEKRSQYEEFYVEHNKLSGLFVKLAKRDNVITTEEIYRCFEQNSYKNISMKNVVSRSQKTGNCYIKEPEQGIQYALATCKLSKEQFEEIRRGERKYSPKWDYPTDVVHRDFVAAVRFENKNISRQLNVLYEIYSKNKKLRDVFDTPQDGTKSLIKAIDAEGRYSGCEHNKRIKLLLAHVNYDTLSKKWKNLEGVVKENYSKDENAVYKMLMSCITPFGRQMFFNYGGQKSALDELLKDASKLFPWTVRQLKYEYHMGYASEAVQHIMWGDFLTAKKMYANALELYPHNSRIVCLKGVCSLSEAMKLRENGSDNFSQLKEAIEDFTKSVILNDRNVVAYVSRSQAYEMLGEFEKARIDKNRATEIEPRLAELLEKYPMERKGKILAQIALADFNRNVWPSENSSIKKDEIWERYGSCFPFNKLHKSNYRQGENNKCLKNYNFSNNDIRRNEFMLSK